MRASLADMLLLNLSEKTTWRRLISALTAARLMVDEYWLMLRGEGEAHDRPVTEVLLPALFLCEVL